MAMEFPTKYLSTLPSFSIGRSAAQPKIIDLQLHRYIFIKFLEKRAALPVTLHKA
jgi:hypothetical protein